MGRARVILADTDESYVHSLQMRFVREFADRIDMEVITDVDYYAELIEIPQQAEVLVVEERLYDPSLLRHSISHIFIMTQQPAEADKSEKTAQSAPSAGTQVTRIFKYTSILEIFSEIVGRSGLSAEAASGAGRTQILLVTSAAGGVGKSLFAMGLCTCLSRNYKRVLYIGAQHLQTFQYLLDNPDPISDSGVYAALNGGRGNVYSELRRVIRQEEFHYLPPFKASLLSLGLPYSLYREAAVSAKESGEFDFIVVDAESCFEEEQLKLTSAADRVLVILNQSAGAVAATGLYVRNVGGTGTDKYIFICNQYRSDGCSTLTGTGSEMLFSVDEFVPVCGGTDAPSIQRLAQEETMRRIAYMLI